MLNRLMANTPRERRHERTKEAILIAALTIISENGADNLSMREIARRIDYSPAGIYEYFAGKEEIIEAVCVRSNEILHALMQTVSPDLPFIDYMVGLGEMYLKYAHEYTANFRLQFNYGATVEPPQEELVSLDDVHNELIFGWLIRIVQQAIDDGHMQLPSGLNTMEVVYSFWSMVHGMAILQISNLRYIDYDFKHINKPILQTFIQGFTQP